MYNITLFHHTMLFYLLYLQRFRYESRLSFQLNTQLGDLAIFHLHQLRHHLDLRVKNINETFALHLIDEI